MKRHITIKPDDYNVQHIAEIVAALNLGNKRLGSTAVNVLRDSFLRALRSDREHYLYLRDPDDLGSFFGCGSAQGGADTMTEDGKICRLYSIPEEECPNCKEDEIEE